MQSWMTFTVLQNCHERSTHSQVWQQIKKWWHQCVIFTCWGQCWLRSIARFTTKQRFWFICDLGGMVLLAGKTVWSMPERFGCTLVRKGAIQILFLSFRFFYINLYCIALYCNAWGSFTVLAAWQQRQLVHENHGLSTKVFFWGKKTEGEPSPGDGW